MGLISSIFGKSPPPAKGAAYAAAVRGNRPAPGEPFESATLVFSHANDCRDDPVFVTRLQWTIQDVLADENSTTPVEDAVRDRLRQKGIAGKRPRTYHLSDDFAPGAELYAVDVDIPEELYDDGFDWSDHNHVLRVQYDLTGAKSRAELVEEVPDPGEVARARLDALLARGAKFVWAELAQANYVLYEDGDESAPFMVMFSFDPAVRQEEMREWCAELHPLKFTNPSDPVLREAVRPLEMDDRSWYYHRRFTLPAKYTRRREVYLADIWAHRPFIDGRFRKRDEMPGKVRRVPCLAEAKKPSGWAGIELIPFDEVDEYRRRARDNEP